MDIVLLHLWIACWTMVCNSATAGQTHSDNCSCVVVQIKPLLIPAASMCRRQATAAAVQDQQLYSLHDAARQTEAFHQPFSMLSLPKTSLR